MANDFNELKKGSKSDFARLSEEAEKLNSGKFQQDDRFWEPTKDKAGNGTAVIRFLPAPKGEEMAFVRYWDHFFKGPGGWYINKSLTTLGKDDPVSEYNSRLWDQGEDGQAQARKQKRKLHYVSNILVVHDPANPDNDGKVFLFDYGKQIFDKLNSAMHPEFEDEEKFNPFDLFKGANLKLRVRKVDGYPNYTSSVWEDTGPLSEDEEEMKNVWLQEYSLQEFVDPSTFKSYDELNARLQKVIGGSSKNSTAERVDLDEDEDEEETAWSPPEDEASSNAELAPDDDDDSLDYFKSLADD